MVVLLFDSDSKYFTFVFLNSLFSCFSNCFLLYSFSFSDLCLAPMHTRTSNPPPTPPFVRGAFLMHVIPIIISLLGCTQVSRRVSRAFYILFSLSFFSQWIL